MTLQFGASLTDNANSVNYNCKMFIIQATGCIIKAAMEQVKNRPFNGLQICQHACKLSLRKFIQVDNTN